MNIASAWRASWVTGGVSNDVTKAGDTSSLLWTKKCSNLAGASSSSFLKPRIDKPLRSWSRMALCFNMVSCNTRHWTISNLFCSCKKRKRKTFPSTSCRNAIHLILECNYAAFRWKVFLCLLEYLKNLPHWKMTVGKTRVCGEINLQVQNTSTAEYKKLNSLLGFHFAHTLVLNS